MCRIERTRERTADWFLLPPHIDILGGFDCDLRIEFSEGGGREAEIPRAITTMVVVSSSLEIFRAMRKMISQHPPCSGIPYLACFWGCDLCQTPLLDRSYPLMLWRAMHRSHRDCKVLVANCKRFVNIGILLQKQANLPVASSQEGFA